MLVIRRKPGEVIVIGQNIEVEILEASASQVKLGISAPKAIPVVRKEIQVVREQNRVASRVLSRDGIEKVLTALQQSSSNPRHNLR